MGREECVYVRESKEPIKKKHSHTHVMGLGTLFDEMIRNVREIFLLSRVVAVYFNGQRFLLMFVCVCVQLCL